MKHVVNIGTFGRFKHAGQPLFDTWVALEDIARKDWWIGIYSQYNLLDYGRNHGLLTTAEIKMIEDAFA